MHETKKNHAFFDILITSIKPDQIPITALVIQNNTIISIAQNKQSIHIEHAEVCAMQRTQKKMRSHSLPTCTLYSLLEPCPMCYGYALHSNIKTIYYIVSSEKSGIYSFFNMENISATRCIKLNYKEDIIKQKLSHFFSTK